MVHVVPDAPADYSDAAFLNAMTERTGCGLILDVYNLECDAHNHGFDIAAFLCELDKIPIPELHVARGVEDNGFLLDLHSKLTHSSTIRMAQDVVAECRGRAEVVTYEFMPEAAPGLGYDAIADELERLPGGIQELTMDLQTHQRKLLGLVRGSYEPTAREGPYIRHVAQSADLQEARRNILLWRIWVLQRTCPLTFSLLKHRQLLGDAVTAFMANSNISQFRETQTPAFLEFMSCYEDTLVASVAQFEMAMIRVREGDETPHVVQWSAEPLQLLNSVATDTPMECEPAAGEFEIIVSHDVPGGFAVVRGCARVNE